MLHLGMDAASLGNTRFAICPLLTTANALLLARPGAVTPLRGWGALVGETVREHGLVLLDALFRTPWDYVPDFISPLPTSPEPALHDQLHAVATVAPGRLRREVELTLHGLPAVRLGGAAPPRALLDALEQGEQVLAERIAGELDRFWRAAVQPRWPDIRARLDDDIVRRGAAMARQGVRATLSGLHPHLLADEDGLRVLTRFHGCLPPAGGVLLVPSVFETKLRMLVDPVSGPGCRQPLFVYPAFPRAAEAGRVKPAGRELLGSTRAALLADLEVPRATDELAQRLGIAPSTVSYHLGILHRSGLVNRRRASHRVMYMRSHRAGGLL